ncbi:MAG: choice-of-anchor D domain-containing protein [Hyphomicrobiales bacterium]
MKKLLTLLLCMVSFYCLADNTMTLENKSNPQTRGAVLEFEPTSLDFGDVNVGESKTLNVTIKNTGTTVLFSGTSDVKAPFSASNLEIPSTMLNAGASIEATVTFTPTEEGSFSQNVKINSTQTNEDIRLPISGNGVVPTPDGAIIEFDPVSLDFGDVKVGDSKSLTVKVKNVGNASLFPGNAAITAPFESADFQNLGIIGAGEEQEVTVTFTPTENGEVSQNVTLSTNHVNTDISLPISGKGLDGAIIEFDPVSLDFGDVKVGDSKSLTVKVKNVGTKSLFPGSAAITAPFESAELQGLGIIGAGEEQEVTITFTPTEEEEFSQNVTLSTNHINTDINLPISGNGITKSILAFEPASLDFGDVNIGETKTLVVKVKNTGNASMMIMSAAISEPFSSTEIQNLASIPAGGEEEVHITFTPTEETEYSQDITLSGNFSNQDAKLPISGNGKIKSGVNEIAIQADIYPNPASDNINVVTEKNINSYKIMNLQGAIIDTKTVNSNNINISINNLESGLYIIQLETENTVISKRFIKK